MSLKISNYRREQQISSVRVCRGTNLAGTYDNGPSNNGVGATLSIAASSLTIDSVVLNNGDRVLLLNQSNSYENGIYQVSGIGAAVLLTRSDDFQYFDQMKPGYYVPVGAGTVYAGTIFTVIEPQVQNVGVDDIIFQDATSNPTSVTLSNTGLQVLDTGGDHVLRFVPNENLTADRNLNFVVNDAARTINLAANLTLSAFGSTLIDDATNLAAMTTLGIKRGTTAAYAGGGTSNAFAATGVVATDIVVASILNSTNAASITTVVPGADTITVGFSADPGAATTVNWIAIPTV